MTPRAVRPSRTGTLSQEQDRGSILIIALVLCLILGVVVAAVATYATVGLRSSRVSKERNERITAADGGLRLGVELLKKDGQCLTNMVVPNLNGIPISVNCTSNGAANTLWAPYLLTSTAAAGGGPTTATAAVQVSKTAGVACTATCTVTINSWAISS